MQKILVICPQIGKILEGKPAGGAEGRALMIFRNYKNTRFLISSKKKSKNNKSQNKFIYIKNTISDFNNIASVIKQSDIILFFALSKFSYIYFYLAKLYNKKIIYFIASNADVGLYLKESSFYYRYVPKLVFPIVDIFICQTELQKKQLKYNKPTYVLPNPTNITKVIKHNNPNYILWIGRNNKVKGVDILEKTIKQLPDIKFKIIGVKSKILESYKNIETLGRINPNKMPKYFNSAVLYINTSYSEGYSNTTLEAFSNKTPVISYSANPDNLLEKSNGGYCANGDLQKFISLIKENYFKKDKLKKMGESGYLYIKNNNNLKTIKNKIEDIFYKNNIKLEK
ncbi:MAG: glycosyltransferase family 4 protein [archaeon]|jgi:glycosyltransferase involved in cell wall biosynthesis